MVRDRVGDWRLAWRFALAGLLAGLMVIALAQTAVTAGTFDAGQDQLFPAPAPDPRITLVAIDQTSANNLGGYPLISNAYHAQVINYLMSLHPSAILFDVPLTVQTPPDPETHADTNQPLIDALKSAAAKIVLVCTADQPPQQPFQVGELVGERTFSTPDAANAVRGVSLTTPQTCGANESREPAFLQALRISEGIDDALVAKGSQVQFGPHSIPLVNGQMLINFTRGTGPTCTYGQIFQGACPHPELITNHIVVVGAKVIDAGDVYSQPVAFSHAGGSFCPKGRPRCMLDNQNYGYRIQADAVSTILQDRYLRTQPSTSIFFNALLLALVVGLLVYVLSFRFAVLVAAGLLGAYYVGVYGLGRLDFLADPLYAPIAIVLGATFSLGARYVLEERERRKVERIFGHYIDPRVARQLAATRSVEELISKGERRDLTVLFVDIRGFTAMSEAMRADDVMAVVQDYLDEMSSLILKWDGLIDKYVGDEIMALWNAPLAQPDHALLAIRCAYDLIHNAPALQARLAARGLPSISWGVGINTGPAVVGNMGSRERLQYTALGDTINTAARFCGAATPFTLLIGWTTYEACSDYIAVDELPGMQLKGKSAETFRVLKVTAIRQDRESPWVPFPAGELAPVTV
ncbi:MAG: adenylate/guanylate cyclase domain-containing protein [Chloroflexi bacterium]|nr:MAG: adenylate/guanylate cyclase domain-containing protein [Chloroflexota bacterium]